MILSEKYGSHVLMSRGRVGGKAIGCGKIWKRLYLVNVVHLQWCNCVMFQNVTKKETKC